MLKGRGRQERGLCVHLHEVTMEEVKLEAGCHEKGEGRVEQYWGGTL